MQLKEKLNFEVSYVLDVLCFIDIMLGNSTKHKEAKEHFKSMLGDTSERYLKKLNRAIPSRESIQNLVLPLIVVDSKFKDFKIEEILEDPKFLITQFKRGSQYKKASPGLKKFLRKDAQKVIYYIRTIIMDLERSKFKTFWLMNQLPIIKHKINEYHTQIEPLQIFKKLNGWIDSHKMIEIKAIYVLTFSECDLLCLMHGHYIISNSINADSIIRSLIDEAFQSQSFKKELKSFNKSIKKNIELMSMFKEVKKEHKKIHSYIENNLLLALTTYFKVQLGVLINPHDYLKSYRRGTYKVSVLFYDYIVYFPKSETQSLPDYILDILDDIKQL